MVKRKPSVGSDLRTNSIGMSVAKYDMTSLRNTSALHWKIGNIQPFFPPIEKLFKTELLDNVKDYIDVYLFGVKQPQDRYNASVSGNNIIVTFVANITRLPNEVSATDFEIKGKIAEIV